MSDHSAHRMPIPQDLIDYIRVLAGGEVREIPTCPNYLVSRDGQVWSVNPKGTSVEFPKEPRKKAVVMRKGVPCVNLVNDGGKPVMHSLLKCVALAYIGLPPIATYEATPIDGNHAHISPDNVEWKSQSELVQRAIDRNGGAFIRGEQMGLSKLTYETVAAMRKDHAEGLGIAACARKYGVSRNTARAALRGEAWKHAD